MSDQVIPEVNRREKETGITRHVIETLIGKQSRKVAFGIWLFIVATALLKASLIVSSQWLTCMYLACALIGFGTVLDDVLLTFGNLVATFAADKVGAIFTTKMRETKISETVTTN